MIDKETYKKEIVRMFASFRNDNNRFSYCLCRAEQCNDCPLLDCCHMHGTVRPYDVFEVIEKVEKWSKEHPQKHKISQLEYDILETFANSGFACYFSEYNLLMSLLKKGYFKGADEKMNIDYYFNHCEVTDDD